jgi:hypothetical protein
MKLLKIIAVYLLTQFLMLTLVNGMGSPGDTPVEYYYFPIDEIFPNPERGFYTFTEYRPGGSLLSAAQIISWRNQHNRSLVMRNYTISEFRDEDISDSWLNVMRQDFARLREAGAKCVLRFRYNTSIGDPDAPLDIVKRHLDQLAPILEENFDVISVMEAGFIGAWGEWHNSTNNLTTTANMREVLFKILEVLPKERMVGVRTPRYKMNIFERSDALTPEEAFNQTNIARTGHHNDGFLASATDLGTYILPVWEKNYLNLDNRYVPMGGETGGVSEGEYYKCSNALQEMEKMRWSYLNSGWYGPTLQSWRDDGCMDEVKQRLGYRFVLTSGKYSQSVPRGGGLSFELNIYNYGWASPFNPRRFEVMLRNQGDGSVYYVHMPDDPRFWLGGDTVTVSATLGIPEEMPAGNYELLVHLPDPAERLYGRPEYSIRLANEGVWESETGFNNLFHVVEIQSEMSTEPYVGELVFSEWSDDVVWVDEGVAAVPDRTHLIGNYPNPFNPVTTIQYEISTRAHVRLSVYNMLGQRVVELVDVVQDAGRHEVQFEASGLSSGVYLYRLQAGDVVDTRSTIFVK